MSTPRGDGEGAAGFVRRPIEERGLFTPDLTTIGAQYAAVLHQESQTLKIVQPTITYHPFPPVELSRLEARSAHVTRYLLARLLSIYLST